VIHEIVFLAAVGWMCVLLGVSAVLVLRAPDAPSRILALDMLVLVLVGVLVLYSGAEEASYWLDAALLLSLLAFIATIAASRYYARGRIF
jgi:multicomponent Na+:H+ antiporter subunit F